MEHCTSYMIGISLSLSAKRIVMMREILPFCGGSTIANTTTNLPTPPKRTRSTTMKMIEKMTGKALPDCSDDDETCSTTSTSETDDDEDDDDIMIDEDGVMSVVYSDCQTSVEQLSRPSVSFATPLVTDIHFRPRTLRQDKALLYYSDADYRSFRRDFHRGEKHHHSVRFLPQVVTDVWKYDVEHDDSLYYSEQEIQDFLDEFVASLLVVVPPT